MKWLLSSDLEGFDGRCGVLLQRLYTRRDELRARLRQIVANLRDGNLQGSSEHNHWTGNRCVPLVEDYVVVFTVEELNEGGELIRHVYLLAVEEEKQKH